MQEYFHLVVVGGGMAAGRLMQQLHARNYDKTVLVVSAERCTGYNRVLLPGLLAGRCQPAEVSNNNDWQAASNYSVLADSSVERIDLSRRELDVGTERTVRFSELVLATGSTVPHPQLTGAKLPQVCQLRSLADVDYLQKLAAHARHAVVVGGGLLGLEAADALHDLGLDVRIVHRGKQLMNRQLDQAGGEQLGAMFVQAGMHLHLGAQLCRIVGAGQVSGIVLDDGAAYAADLVLFATGARPNIQLAEQAGLRCDYAICTDSHLRTNADGVYALGECASVGGHHYSLVDATHAQADALASTLTGRAQQVDPFTPGTRLKVSGTSVFAAGETRPQQQANANDVVVSDSNLGIYRRLLFDGSKLIGAVLMGNTDAAREITQRIGTAVTADERDRLCFGFS